MREEINARWKWGDDTAAASWLWRRHRLKFRPQCLRYFRRCERAYRAHEQKIIRAYRKVQRERQQ